MGEKLSFGLRFIDTKNKDTCYFMKVLKCRVTKILVYIMFISLRCLKFLIINSCENMCMCL